MPAAGNLWTFLSRKERAQLIFKRTGQIAPDFYALGTPHFPTHLLDGSRPVLFESGLSCLGPLYEKELLEVLGQRRPQILFLTHVHFDHCGAAAYLQQAWPGLEIAASQKSADIVARPNAQKTVARLNRQAAEAVEKEAPGLTREVEFQPFSVDLVLAEGDRLELSPGLSLEVLATPGHTWDALSYYLPQKKLLVAGEAAGCQDFHGFISTEFLVDFDAYLESLRRLAGLEVEILCQSHYLIFTGPDVGDFFQRSLEAAGRFKERVERLLDQEQGDVAAVMRRMKAEEYDNRPGPRQPESAYMLNLEARVRHLAQKRQN